MPSLGPAEILVVLVIALLVFGPNKMPEIARQVGKGMREFKRVQQHLKSELRDVVSEFDAPSTTSTVDVDPVPMLPPKDDEVVVAPDPAPTAAPTAADAPAAVDPPAATPPASDSTAEPAASEPAGPAEPA
jgi:sec-independent protein translocase protein TatA